MNSLDTFWTRWILRQIRRPLPPTAVTLGELAEDDSVTGILAQRRVLTLRLPKVMTDGKQAWLAMPHQL